MINLGTILFYFDGLFGLPPVIYRNSWPSAIPLHNAGNQWEFEIMHEQMSVAKSIKGLFAPSFGLLNR